MSLDLPATVPPPDPLELVRVAYFDPFSGRIVARYTGPRLAAEVNRPVGCLAAESTEDIDATTHRVNVLTRTVERKPQHEVDAERAQRDAADTEASTKRLILDLERKQARAVREHTIGRGGTPAELRKRLEDIDDQIIALRATLQE
jgi:hypothetical protein